MIAPGVKRVLGFLNSAAHYLFLVCGGIAVINVVLRYVLNAPIYWAEEVNIILLVWFVYLSQGWLEVNDEQIRMTALYTALPAKAQKVLDGIRVIVTVAFSLYLVKACWEVILINFEQGNKTSAVGLPIWLLYSVILIAFVSLVFGSVTAYLNKWHKVGENR